MSAFFRFTFWTRRRPFLLAMVLFVAAGCGSTETLDRLGISGLGPSKAWSPADPAAFLVPGRGIAAWTGPEGASLVVFRALPSPRTAPSGLIREMTSRLENLPELRIVKAVERTVGGVPVAWVEIVAPGTGDALAPSGLGRPIPPEGRTLVPTRRIAIGFPGKEQTIWLLWHAPESSAPVLATEVDAAIANITIRVRPSSAY